MPYADYNPGIGRITVLTKWSEKNLIQSVPGARWDHELKTWTVPLSWGCLVILRGVFGDSLTIGQKLNDRVWKLRKERIDPAMAGRSELHRDSAGDDEHLYGFQRAGVHFMDAAHSGLLGDEMGCGKSIQALSLMKKIYDRGETPFPALIICPNSVKKHWEAETKKWFPEAVPYVIDGTPVRKRKMIGVALENPNAVVIINIESVRLFSRVSGYGSIRLKRCRECDPAHGDEGLSASSCQVHRKELNEFRWEFVVLDEAHRIKEPSALQTRAVWHVMHQSTGARKWALTGTPLANHPGDLWSIMHAIAPDDFPTRTSFVDRYCQTGWSRFGTREITGINKENQAELFRVLDPRFRRMLKSVVLAQLPPKVRQVRHVALTPEQGRMYKELTQSMTTTTPDGELLMTFDDLTLTGRFMQVASSSIRLDKADPDAVDTWKVTLREPSSKLDAMEDILLERGMTSLGYDGAPVIVAAESKQLINLAAKRLDNLGIRHALITGDVSPHDRQRALEKLSRREISVLLFTNKAGGVGLNMSESDTLINLQRSWSMIDEVQKESRNHRIGSDKYDSVTIIDIVAVDTVEERQIQVLSRKMDTLEQINRDKAALILAGITEESTEFLELDTLESNVMEDMSVTELIKEGK